MGLREMIDRVALEMMRYRPRPPRPCGTKERPHLVALGEPGDVRRCVTCGQVGTIPEPG